MKTIRYMVMTAAGLALSGCVIADVNDVDRIRDTDAQGGTPFTQALTDEYRKQAIYESQAEYEWYDAGFFARKGLQAANGEAVMPSDVGAAPADAHLRYGDLGPVILIPPDRVGELSAARGRLTAFLNSGGRDRLPVVAAHGQGLFDCWLEEEWEGETNIDCRTDFLALESQFTTTKTITQVTPPAATSRMVNSYQVFFDFDRSNISSTAAQIIDQAAASAKQGNVTRIDLTGHTDAAGSDAYNQALSERRAKAVKQQLVTDGIPADEITTVGVGKADQIVPTADGVREPQNRRTEIKLH